MSDELRYLLARTAADKHSGRAFPGRADEPKKGEQMNGRGPATCWLA